MAKTTRSPLSPAPAPDPAADDPVRTVLIELPLLASGRYATRTVRRDLSARAARAFRDLQDGLTSEGCRLNSGRKVEDLETTLEYLAERLAEGQKRSS